MADPNYQEIGAFNRYPTNINPLLQSKYKFTIRKIPNVSYFCTGVDIPSMELGSVNQATPFQDLPLPGTGIDFEDLEVNFLVTEDLKNYFEIVKWINGLGFPKNFDQYASLKKENKDINAEYGGIWSDAILHILSNEGNPTINIRFKDAFPVKLSRLQFRSDLPEPEPLIATVVFKYAYYDYEYVT